jgi:hypothetical protein
MKLKIQKSLRQGIFTEQVTASNSNTKTTHKPDARQMREPKKKKKGKKVTDRPVEMGVSTTIHIQR